MQDERTCPVSLELNLLLICRGVRNLSSSETHSSPETHSCSGTHSSPETGDPLKRKPETHSSRNQRPTRAPLKPGRMVGVDKPIHSPPHLKDVYHQRYKRDHPKGGKICATWKVRTGIILGCGSYGFPSWREWILDEKEGLEHIKFAYDNGINTFDTANTYSNGESERILGKALKEYNIPRENVVIMTKLFFPVGEGDNPLLLGGGDENGFVNRHGLSRKHIFAAVKDSLKRLDVDYIDVLQCHRLDPDTPFEEIMQALHDVVKAGHVLYIGMSSCYAWQFYAMQSYAIARGLTPFISMQSHYSLLYREDEREMIPLLKHLGVGRMAWSPLAGGLLARPWGETSTRGKTDLVSTPMHDGNNSEAIVRRVEELAKKKDVKMAQIAVAWSLKRATAPIVGATKLQNLKETIEALDIELTEEEIKYLEEPYLPNAIWGHS